MFKMKNLKLNFLFSTNPKNYSKNYLFSKFLFKTINSTKNEIPLNLNYNSSLNFISHNNFCTMSSFSNDSSSKIKGGKFKNTKINKKPIKTIKTYQHDFAAEQKENELKYEENYEQVKIKGNSEFQKILEKNEFNNIIDKLNNFDIDEIQDNEIKNKIDEDFIESNEKKENFHIKNKKKRGSFQDKFINEDSEDHVSYMNQYNYILNFSSEFNRTKFFDSKNIDNLHKFLEKEDEKLCDIQNQEKGQFTNEMDYTVYNHNIINDYNNFSSIKKYKKEKIGIEEYNKIMIEAFYKLIDLIPKNQTKIKFYIEIIQLIDLKRIIDENLIFFFMEKCFETISKVGMNFFCNISSKLLRFQCISKFYYENLTENLKENYAPDDDYFLFFDDYLISMNKKEYLKKNRIKHPDDYEITSDEERYIDKNESEYWENLKNENYEKNKNFIIKNLRLESYIKNVHQNKKNEIFNILYIIENDAISNFYKKISGVEGEYNILMKNKMNLKSVEEQNEDKDHNLNSIKNDIKNKTNFSNESNIYNKNIEALDIINSFDRISNEEDSENNFNDRNKQENLEEVKIKEFDKEIILAYLIEEERKFIKIFEFIKTLPEIECIVEKRIILIKLYKINFLVRFYKNFEFFDDPKLIAEIVRTYRYLFMLNIDFKISELMIKKIIIILNSSNFYNSFILTKNIFMILWELSINKSNHELLKQKSDYFKVILNFFFCKINYSNFTLLSFKEMGILIFMVGETKLGTDNLYKILNNYVINEMGGYIINRKFTSQTIGTFYRFITFTLMGFSSNLEKYNYEQADKLIIKFLDGCEKLNTHDIFKFSLNINRLNHNNINIWYKLYKIHINTCCTNSENSVTNVKFVLDYFNYIKKKRFRIEELNRAFINFYISKFIDFVIKRKIFDDCNYDDINIKNNYFSINSEEENDNEIITENNSEEILTENNNEENKTLNIDEEMEKNIYKSNNQIINKSEYLELIKKFNDNSYEFDEKKFDKQTDSEIFKNIDIIFKFCIDRKKKHIINIKNITYLSIFKLKIDKQFLLIDKTLFFNRLINGIKLENDLIKIIQETLFEYDFDNAKYIHYYLHKQIVDKNSNIKLYNKFYDYYKNMSLDFARKKSILPEDQIKVYKYKLRKFKAVFDDIEIDNN